MTYFKSSFKGLYENYDFFLKYKSLLKYLCQNVPENLLVPLLLASQVRNNQIITTTKIAIYVLLFKTKFYVNSIPVFFSDIYLFNL